MGRHRLVDGSGLSQSPQVSPISSPHDSGSSLTNVSSSSARVLCNPTTLQATVRGDATFAARMLGRTTTLQASVHGKVTCAARMLGRKTTHQSSVHGNVTGDTGSFSFPRWHHLLQHLTLGLHLRMGGET